MRSTVPVPACASTARVISIDAFRGFVMLLMMTEILRLGPLASLFPGKVLWSIIHRHHAHVDWAGCSLFDLIQPAFSFLVGLALWFSLNSRLLRGQSPRRMWLHALWRSAALIALGVFLRSIGHKQTNWVFEDTLVQIGLGYVPLFFLGLCRKRVQWAALAVILFGTWLAYALFPAPGPEFDYASVGVGREWLNTHGLSGFEAHWNKNSNFGWAFDTWFLNLFPRKTPFVFSGGGYATLNFIPMLGTMILGLVSGPWMSPAVGTRKKLGLLLLAGGAGLASGWLLGALGICPIVKRIWTPAWTLYSGGWCFVLMAAFYGLSDMLKFRAFSYPLVVIGANPIVAYCANWLFIDFIADNLRTHLGNDFFGRFGEGFRALFQGSFVLLAWWLILFWMYRRKIFVRI